MDDLPTLNINTATLTWNGDTYDIIKLHKVLKRDEKAMSYKRKAIEKYRRSDKGKAKQKEANMRFRNRNKENTAPPNSPQSV